MYHISNIKHWFGHLHMPAFVHSKTFEKFIHNERLWTALAITLFVVFFTILTLWAATQGPATDTFGPHSPYAFPMTP